jgi:hypothetical protein
MNPAMLMSAHSSAGNCMEDQNVEFGVVVVTEGAVE